ncbi:MAG: helicase-related protein [Anaerolineae bacterium]
MPEIQPGQIIRGPRWPEPVEVKLAEWLGGYVYILGVTTASGQHIDHLLPESELAQLEVIRVQSDFGALPRHFFLSLEALRYRFASLYDPLLAMNTSKVDPLPHQIEAVYGYVLKLPRIRFLIADDPGAGKTIMAGLALKELKLRGLVRRSLIVAPGHLKDQWRREMKERFEEEFVVIDRALMDAFYGVNPWQRESQIITSMDFAKQDDILPSLAATNFDLVIVDEAHKMSAYRYGDKVERTDRYRLGETLSTIATHLLFLTATPHRGDPENFRLFLDLLEPGFFATAELLDASIRANDNPLLIRRVKEDLRDLQGRPLFLARYVQTKKFNLGIESPSEKDLYNALSQYVNREYNRVLARDKRRNVAFALVILQRRLASSTYALLCSLQRRKRRLEELLRGAEQGRPPDVGADWEVAEEMSEEERWKLEELWETLSVAETREELEREICTVDALIRQAQAVLQAGEEVKLRHFRRALDELQAHHPGEKILIFTESRDTLTYLDRCLREWGYSVCTIHGGMRLEERIKAEGVFKNEAQVMVATEAAGEGINLQFCHLMINYDIPWNPNRLEQRMGRIHRYGQTREVYVFNMVADDTREGRVLVRLFDKLDEIRQALGSDRVFDVLGEVFHGKDLAQLLVEAAANTRSLADILAEIDLQVDEECLRQVRQILGEGLATRYIDYTRIRDMADRAREHRLIPEYTQAFFLKAMQTAGGQVRERRDGLLAVDRIPYEVRRLAEDDTFKKQHGILQRAYPMVTFDKDVAYQNPDAEFISFGHPLFEAILAWVERDLTPVLPRGAVFTDPAGRLDGFLLFYQGEVHDGLGQVADRRLFTLYVDRATGQIEPEDPCILWDLQEGGDNSGFPSSGLEPMKEAAVAALLPILAAHQAELQTERDRQAQIKERYGVRSLEHLILTLDGDLIRLHDRLTRGERVELPIRKKEEQKRGYEVALCQLRRTIEQERTLTMGMPTFVGAARIVPSRDADPAFAEDPDIERLGVQSAMAYEQAQGRQPEDVSDQNLGFDVRSTDPPTGRKRYIEVKARAGVGPVALTQNEWFKAGRFHTEYYLYVVLNAATQPELYIIQDPAANLQPEERVEVRYLVDVREITGKGIRDNPSNPRLSVS